MAEDCEAGEYERDIDGTGTPEWKEQPEATYFAQDRIRSLKAPRSYKTCT